MSLRPEHSLVLPQLLMRRHNLDGLPPMPDLPPDYAVRPIQPGEEAALTRVLQGAFPEYIWNEDEVRRRLTQTMDVEATYVAALGSELVACASARFVPERYAASGYLHWVAVLPEQRGLRLGRAVTIRVLHHFREAGRPDSVLETDDHRLPAIRTYLGLGYQPEPVHESHRERWSAVYDSLVSMRDSRGREEQK